MIINKDIFIFELKIYEKNKKDFGLHLDLLIISAAGGLFIGDINDVRGSL